MNGKIHQEAMAALAEVLETSPEFDHSLSLWMQAMESEAVIRHASGLPDEARETMLHWAGIAAMSQLEYAMLAWKAATLHQDDRADATDALGLENLATSIGQLAALLRLHFMECVCGKCDTASEMN